MRKGNNDVLAMTTVVLVISFILIFFWVVFDVTVANSLQPSFIIKAASNAGAAAEAAEDCQDFRHADRVTAADGIFYPLAVETLGLWTPYSLKILRSIASRISAMSHMTFSKSLNNLLQQLPVKVWSYNARLVLQRLNLEIEDVRSWDMHT